MSLMVEDYYTIQRIMSKIEEELIIQNVNLQIGDLDEIYNLLSDIFQNRK